MDILTLKRLYNTLSGLTVHGEANLDGLLACLQVIRGAIEGAEKEESTNDRDDAACS